jgi:hypothetical protein
MTSEEKKQYKAEYRKLNRDKINEYNKMYREKNKERDKEKKQEYNKMYRETYKETRNKQYNERMKNDPLFKFKQTIRNLIRVCTKKRGVKKTSRTEQILGCTYEEFYAYLESKFEPWMNWDNKGLYNGKPNYGWDIDHITPTSTATTDIELIKLNHYTNLQPLCSHYNRDIKKDNI